MTREMAIVLAQRAAFAALPGLLAWDEAGVVARDVLDSVSPAIHLDDDL